MARFPVVVLVALLLSASPAFADAIPEYVLDHDYTSCMGNETPQKDPQRAEYCNCVRDQMRSWDMDTYGELAMQQSKSGDADHVPEKIGEIAKACIEKVLHP